MSRDLDILSRDPEPDPKIPAHLLTDPVARAWLEVFEAGSPSRGWDHGDVDFLLKEAFTLLRRLGGRVGPKRDAGFWPPITRSLRDGDTLGDESGGRRTDPAAVTRMEATLDWLRPGRPRPFLPPDTEERNALMLWCWCIEHGVKFTDAVAELAAHGVKKATIDRKRRRASMMIATRLILADTPIPAVALRARETRPRSNMHAAPVDLAESVSAAASERTVPLVPSAADASLGAFWDLIRLHAAGPDAIERANAVYAAIYDRVRWEHRGSGRSDADLAAMTARRRRLTFDAIALGLLDPGARAAARRGRAAQGQAPYSYAVGTATVRVAQDGGWYGREAAWVTHVYQYEIEGEAEDVEAARDAVLRAFPAETFRTSFTPLEPVEPGRVRTAGWRSASAD